MTEPVSMIQRWSVNHGKTILRVTVMLMAAQAVVNLGCRFTQFADGGWDLWRRYDELHLWFSGETIYDNKDHYAVYPPASYLMLLPFLGFSSFAVVRFIWGTTMAALLAVLTYLLVKESQAESNLERGFVALIPLSAYATGGVIGHGQLTIHVLTLLVAGILLLHRQTRGREIFLGSALIVCTLMKPTFSLPFLAMILFFSSGLGSICMIGIGYLLLTILATARHGFDILFYLKTWLVWAVRGTVWTVREGEGYGNLHNILAFWGTDKLIFLIVPISLLMLFALVYWLYRNRDGDLWISLGVTAVVTRFWTYHNSYDDMLILLPIIALFRLTKQNSTLDKHTIVGGILIAAAVVGMMMPIPFIRLMPFGELFISLFRIVQTTVWLLMLLFLCYQSGRIKSNRSGGRVGRVAGDVGG